MRRNTLSGMNTPTFEELPFRKGDPNYSAWGLWGHDDQLGTLNWLSPSVVKDATSEIREGNRFSLNWSLSHPRTPAFGRYKHEFSHSIIGDGHVLDDMVTFNTQRSTQWDGLRHFAYQKEQLFYNGTKRDDIVSSSEGTLGMHWWHKAGCIAGRGFLIDYRAYADSIGHEYDASRPHGITFEGLMDCLEWQQKQSGEELKPKLGDILLIRTGFSARYHQLDDEQERRVGESWPPTSCGVHQDIRLLKWLWETHFAAVGGDAPGWELFPTDMGAGFCYHEVLIAGWGCPIAELLWLEDLSKWCLSENRWSFFLTSSPLNIHGGVASPANMIALV